jgi:peroxiredoxin Q/BCP
VGSLAPDFRLQDQDGKVHRLSEYRDKNIVLVMYRGWWCTQCTMQLGRLRTLLDDRMKSTTQILALSSDDVEGARKMVERQKTDEGAPPNFPLLADPGHKVIDRYGQLNPEPFKHRTNPDGYIVAYPAVFVINRQGVVTWKFTHTDNEVRAPEEEILAAIRALEGK